MRLVVALCALAGFLACAWSYEVPEPLIEVFHPKGIRVAIPDSEGTQSVRLQLEVTPQGGDSEFELSGDFKKNEEGNWVYWNPEVTLNEKDEIYYKVTVEQDGIHWVKEGEYIVDEVISMDGEVINADHIRVLRVPSVNLFRHRNFGLITEGKQSSYRSSYSSYQSSDSKPVTRSSTSSKTGSFVTKDDGDVEASGYKKTSDFDSTRREGEQWEFSESKLSPEELEDMRRFTIGQVPLKAFAGLGHEDAEEFTRTMTERIRGNDRISSTSRTHEEFSESSRTSRDQQQLLNERSRIQPPSPHHFQEYHDRATAAIRETATGRHVSPGSVHNLSVAPNSQPVSSNQYEEHRYNHASSSTVSHPVPLSAGDSPDYQQEVPVVLPSSPSRQSSSRNYEYSSRGESHSRVVSHQTPSRSTPQVGSSATYVSTSDNRADRHLASASQHRENYDEYDNVQVVEKPKYQVENHYKGSIFRSVATSRVNSPQECTVWSDSNYDRVTDFSEIKKSISKMNCLASLAEHSLKEELKLLKQENSELKRRLDSLDRDFRRYQNTCRCSG